MKKKAVVCVFLVSLGLSVLGAPPVVAAQYMGETTWTLTITQGKNGDVTAPVGITTRGCITRMGGAYYTMQIYADPAMAQNPIGSGGGVLVGNLLYFTLDLSQVVGNGREAGVIRAELDKATLSGTLYTVSRSFDTTTIGPNPVFTDYFWAGTLTRIGPAINLTPVALVGFTTLLLLGRINLITSGDSGDLLLRELTPSPQGGRIPNMTRETNPPMD